MGVPVQKPSEQEPSFPGLLPFSLGERAVQVKPVCIENSVRIRWVGPTLLVTLLPCYWKSFINKFMLFLAIEKYANSITQQPKPVCHMLWMLKQANGVYYRSRSGAVAALTDAQKMYNPFHQTNMFQTSMHKYSTKHKI